MIYEAFVGRARYEQHLRRDANRRKQAIFRSLARIVRPGPKMSFVKAPNNLRRTLVALLQRERATRAPRARGRLLLFRAEEEEGGGEGSGGLLIFRFTVTFLGGAAFKIYLRRSRSEKTMSLSSELTVRLEP